MQTEKRNIYNCPVSVKTSVAEIYCNKVHNNISRLVRVGFFMPITVSGVVMESAFMA